MKKIFLIFNVLALVFSCAWAMDSSDDSDVSKLSDDEIQKKIGKPNDQTFEKVLANMQCIIKSINTNTPEKATLQNAIKSFEAGKKTKQELLEIFEKFLKYEIKIQQNQEGTESVYFQAQDKAEKKEDNAETKEDQNDFGGLRGPCIIF
jgi:hypothetical protein